MARWERAAGPVLYGVLAEFATPEALLAAVGAARAAGYRKLEAYTPYPIPGLYEALGLGRTLVPTLVLCGGLFGCIGGFFLQYYLMAVDYPLNVGGRPLNSWPAFIPITFELTILCAALTALIGLFALNRLPQLDHPLFGVDRFALVTQDRYFLLLEAADAQFARGAALSFLLAVKASEVTDVHTVYPEQTP